MRLSHESTLDYHAGHLIQLPRIPGADPGATQTPLCVTLRIALRFFFGVRCVAKWRAKERLRQSGV